MTERGKEARGAAVMRCGAGSGSRVAPAAIALLLVACAAGCSRGPSRAPAGIPPPATFPAPPDTTAAAPGDAGGYRALRDSTAAIPREVFRGRSIVIDPGHGGRHAGVVGAGGLREADVNLAVARELAALLTAAGARVTLTRDGDREVAPPGRTVRDDLLARAAIADSVRPDLFLSIHHNSSLPVDTTRNTSDIFFRLNDDGPSFDAARHIHRALVRNLGLPPGAFTPANYLVLRESDVPAVLSEASFLSNPRIEERLRSPDAVRLEAGAYYLGIGSWLAAGIPSVREATPGAPSPSGPGPVFRLAIDAPGGVDPSSLRATIDGREAATWLGPQGRDAWIRAPEPLPDGPHRVAFDLRNTAGNASPRWTRDFEVVSPPAAITLDAYPPSLPARGESMVRVTVRCLDAAGHLTGRGPEPSVEITGGRALRGGTRRVDGIVELQVVSWPSAESVRVAATIPGIDSAAILVTRQASAPSLVWGRITEAASPGSVIAGASLLAGEPAPGPVVVDGEGWYLIPVPGDAAATGSTPLVMTLEARAPGFEPVSARVTVPGRGVPVRRDIGLVPRGGALRGFRVLLDPAGGGDDTGWVSAEGTRGKDLNLSLARRIAWRLGEAGAVVALTRDRDACTSAVDRVRAAESGAPGLVIRLDRHPGAPGLFATVSHYPGSAAGTAFADSIAARLGRMGHGAVASAETVTFTVQQASAPGIDIALHDDPDAAAFPAAGRPESIDSLAAAIVDGVRGELARAARAAAREKD